MNLSNIVQLQQKRELNDFSTLLFQRKFHVTDTLIARLGLEAELEGHSGCVNCLEWNERGDLLASGSDDVHVVLWDPFRHKKLTTLQTGHHGNIFSIKFLPKSNDGVLVSGAADCKIRVHDLNLRETTQVCYCHAGRIKRIATAPNIPYLFWSAAEDGLVMQFDLRTPHTCSNTCTNVLINLLNHMGKSAEAKCLAINPLRPELLAVGANDPYVRLYDRRMISPSTIKYPEHHPRSPWERSYIARSDSSEDDNLPAGCVQYFVAGHLPIKQQDYKKRYRTLASTYLTFSPDGTELLVNLGGEQIYLFNINQSQRPRTLELQALFSSTNGINKDNFSIGKNADNVSNGFTSNGMTRAIAPTPVNIFTTSGTSSSNEIRSKATVIILPPKCEALKLKANAVFEKQQFTLAINLYNDALRISPDAAVLYTNRAAALMKRGWDGDLYAALRDCYTALTLDHSYLKAHFRLARCLFELQWTKEAMQCLQLFKSKFPDHAQSSACENLDKDIKASMLSKPETGEKEEGSSESNSSSSSRKSRKPTISNEEESWRAVADDYESRFCGHCNTTTDIKEANFFGSHGQYIVAGSDDGSFFIWDRISTNIIRVLHGDDSIVNCLQPHPSHCLLATSGIDPVVRLWSPRPEDGQRDDREVVDSDHAALENQKRMNADPLEVMLMNMGYRIRGVVETDEEVDMARDTTEVQCRPS